MPGRCPCTARLWHGVAVLYAPHQNLLEELEARQEEVLRQLEELEERIRRTIEQCVADMTLTRDGTRSEEAAS